MRKQQMLFTMAVVLFVIVLSGCAGSSNVKEIKGIPADAQQVMTLDLDGRSGTYTVGKIMVPGSGYMILDSQLNSGTIGAIAIRDTVSDDDTCIVRRPKEAIYACEPYDYLADREYTFSLGAAKNVTGAVYVYFVADSE